MSVDDWYAAVNAAGGEFAGEKLRELVEAAPVEAATYADYLRQFIDVEAHTQAPCFG